MYESPKLNRVGDAEKVILGIGSVGDDMDGCWVPGPAQFAPDGDFEQEQEEE